MCIKVKKKNQSISIKELAQVLKILVYKKIRKNFIETKKKKKLYQQPYLYLVKIKTKCKHSNAKKLLLNSEIK